MDFRAKVWPISVDSLDNSGNLSLKYLNPAEKSSLKSIKFKRRLRLDQFNKLFICTSTGSDVCFVAGAILIIIGILVASLGIYPNNQVSF